MHMLTQLSLAPILLIQALGVLARVERLPEAAGPRAGQSGQGQEFRLLILGDSSAAGVGVAHQDAALSGQMLAHLAPHARVTWQLVARSGVTTAQARKLAPAVGRFDVAVLALGVNDVLRQTRAKRFAHEQTALMHELRQRHSVQHVLASAVPPLGAFAVFPQQLRAHLGRRAAALDRVLQQVCTATGAQHVPFDLDPDPHWLARDGLHPGGPLYAEWGRRMAGLALDRLS